MTEEKIICSECGTENESKYLYCKNCGAVIKKDNKNEGQTDNTYYGGNANYNYNAGAQQNGYACIDGIPIEEVQMFIGKKANDIIPKFINMEITHSKNSWLWPPAVLAFLMGPMGAALWFFYRKMYKPAFVFVGISAIISLITSLLTFEAINDYSNSLFLLFSSGEFDTTDIITSYQNSIGVKISSSIENISNLLTCVIVGLFSCSWYKNHCITKIKEFRMMNPNNNYYRLGLMSLGGTSGGMVFLGITILIGISLVVSVIVATLLS